VPGISTLYANHTLDAILGKGFSIPDNLPTVYVALCTVQPTSVMSGQLITEPTHLEYSGYQRVPVLNNETNWPDAFGETKHNGVSIGFPASAGGASSPITINWWAACDAMAEGNLVTFGQLDTPLVVSAGVAPTFPIGALVCTQG
jgi:hypothetical protein